MLITRIQPLQIETVVGAMPGGYRPRSPVGGIRLDSWASILTAVRLDRSTLDLLVERVSETYLGTGDG